MHAVRFTLLLFALALLGCVAGSVTHTGQATYPAVPVSQVEVLGERPTRSFQTIGIVTAKTGSFGSPSSAIAKMRADAAKLGADALLVSNIDQAFYTNTTGTAIRWK
jgi:hypothetical protein